MCGILLVARGVAVRFGDAGRLGGDVAGVVAQEDEGATPSFDSRDFLTSLQARGPDSCGVEKISLGTNCELELTGCLLHIRGQSPCPLPLRDVQGNVLLFNGEVFDGLDVASEESDTFRLAEALRACDDDVPSLLSRLRGPWSLIYWQQARKRLWFGRDGVGRRSLLLHRSCGRSDPFILTSVVPEQQSSVQNANSEGPSLSGSAVDSTWAGLDSRIDPFVDDPPTSLRSACGGGTGDAIMIERSATVSAVAWEEVPPGVYSIALELSRDGLTQWGTLEGHLWTDPIWGRLQRPLGETEEHGVDEQDQGNCALHLDAPPSPGTSDPCPTSSSVLQVPGLRPDSFDYSACQFLVKMSAAVKTRCCCIDRVLQSGSETPEGQRPAPVLILFSGGVDSTLLAALTHRALPPGVPIDLANVSFDGLRSPDRQGGRSSVEELSEWAPDRLWRLIEVDSDLAEVDRHRNHLLSLLCPASLVMDLNIGAALWLAARGRGRLYIGQGNGQQHQALQGLEYTSASKIVLLGHGADEQCAGYVRHSTRFREGGWKALGAELRLEVERLWIRNLGRDDRLIADHGREARFPFLCEDVMSFLAHVPLWHLFDPERPRGSGDKMVVRTALRLLGLPGVAERKKCAIQFGCRISKRANQRDFGGQRKADRASAGYVKLADVAPAKMD
eukprot:evm.model.scf_78.13 EVM.evm.TU.scf_78.13   scf_78:150143-155524(-)